MTKHPGRKPGRAHPLRMTPAQLADLLARTALTQDAAADLAGVERRTMERWLSGERAMPRTSSIALCLSCAALGFPAGIMAPWLPAVVAAKLGHPHADE